jgi:hypothetical protein
LPHFKIINCIIIDLVKEVKVSTLQNFCNMKNKTEEGAVKTQWLCVTRCSTAVEGGKGWLFVMRLTAGRVSGFGIREEQKERNKKTSRKGKKLGCSRAESPGI